MEYFSKPILLVTGASRGIGQAIAAAFAQAGWIVYGCARQVDDVMKDEAVAAGYCLLPADVSDGAAVEALIAGILEKHGHITCLINNAGVAHYGLFQDMSEAAWDQLMEINLKSAFLCSRAVIPGMLRASGETGADPGCSILHISSIWGTVGASTEAAYSASKGAMNALTKALAKELGPSGIRVNAIACGAIDTGMNAHLSPSERQDLEAAIPLGRFGSPREVAALALFLASDKAAYLTGAVIPLDGGMT